MSRIAQKILFTLPTAGAASLLVAMTAFAEPLAVNKLVDISPIDANGSLSIDPKKAETKVKVAESSIKAEAPLAPAVAKNEAISPDAIEIKPGDWQYDALKSLATKYDCSSDSLSGQAISRDTFVDGLNSCLKKVEPILAKNSDRVSAEELDTLGRLTQEFRAELSNIDTRVEKVQQRTALAQTSQFSTTTKLKGEVIVGFNTVLAGGAPGSNATVANRARLLLESTFNGKDRLFTRLTANNGGDYGNFKNGPSNSEANQTYFGGNNAVGLDWLAYQFPIGSGSVYVGAYNGIHSDYAETHSTYLQDFTGGSGAISFLAEENPIYKVGGGTGVGVAIPLGSGGFLDSVNLSYFAGTTANSPANGNGFLAGRNSYLAQVNFKPSDKFDFGLTYVNAYHNGGGIYDFGGGGAVVGSLATGPASIGGPGYNNSNSYGLSASFKPSDSLNINGYITKTSATTVANANRDILTYGIGLAFPKVGQPGNLLGFFIGQAPTVTNDAALASSAYHLEGFYKYKVNDNISITPGLIYLTNPNQVLTNSTGALLGTVRTTFTF